MREPKTDQEYLDLMESLADQWFDNISCADCPSEVWSINQWYMNSLCTLINQYFHKRMKAMYN